MTRSQGFVWHGVLLGTMAVGGLLAFGQHGGGTAPAPVQHSGGASAAPSGQHSGGGVGSTAQNTSTGNPGTMGNTQDYSMDDMARRNLEEKRGKMMNSERQRMMVREANQLVMTTAELESSVEQGAQQGSQGAARDEAMRRADMIEKLARNVKERMKGGR